MEISRILKPTFSSILLAKYRNVLRRSIWLYGLSIAMMTYGLHGYDSSISSMELIIRGLIYFGAVCFTMALLLPIAAAIQSRRIEPYSIVFRKGDLCAIYKGAIIADSWDWVVSAKDEPLFISMRTRKLPFTELFLSKKKLTQTEYLKLCQWLRAHRKLKYTKSAFSKP